MKDVLVLYLVKGNKGYKPFKICMYKRQLVVSLERIIMNTFYFISFIYWNGLNNCIFLLKEMGQKAPNTQKKLLLHRWCSAFWKSKLWTAFSCQAPWVMAHQQALVQTPCSERRDREDEVEHEGREAVKVWWGPEGGGVSSSVMDFHMCKYTCCKKKCAHLFCFSSVKVGKGCKVRLVTWEHRHML